MSSKTKYDELKERIENSEITPLYETIAPYLTIIQEDPNEPVKLLDVLKTYKAFMDGVSDKVDFREYDILSRDILAIPDKISIKWINTLLFNNELEEYTNTIDTNFINPVITAIQQVKQADLSVKERQRGLDFLEKKLKELRDDRFDTILKIAEKYDKLIPGVAGKPPSIDQSITINSSEWNRMQEAFLNSQTFLKNDPIIQLAIDDFKENPERVKRILENRENIIREKETEQEKQIVTIYLNKLASLVKERDSRSKSFI